MKVNMKDVAKRAGVSVATVSYVINQTRNVKEETRKKVEQAIEELNYTPDVSAQKLKSGQSRLVGLITPRCNDSFSASIIEACESALTKEGYQLLILNTSFRPEVERNAINILSSGIVDGIILISICENSVKIQQELPANFPCVLASCTFPDSPVDSVGFSSFTIMQDVVGYIREKGHKNLGILAGPTYLSSTQERLTAYRRALQLHQLDYDRDYYVHTSRADHNIREQVQKLAEKGCRAFLFSNSSMLLDTFQDQETGSFSVPAEYDVITFCDSVIDRDYFRMIPKVLCPTETLGTLACQRLLSRIKGDQGPVRRILLDCTFDSKEAASISSRS